MGFVDTLFDPFIDNAFMQRALLAGILVALMCAVVGTYVVLRGMAFIGDALAHGVLPGVAGAVIFGFSSLLGAAIGAGVMIGGVNLVTKRSKLSSDTAIGLLFVGLLAIGVVMVSSSDRLTGDIDAILFGEFLGVDWWDIRVLGVAVVLVG
ncbi:MAG: metal ABC transporter permease, partial [Ilumatobacteraceae bacterium]